MWQTKWVRINFDDGDFEDFDKDCVVKGLELYEKYKDLDPNPEGVVAPVAAAAAGVDEGRDINIDDDDDDDDDDDRFIAAANVNNKRNNNNTDDHASDEKESTTTTATTTVDNGSNGDDDDDDDDDGELEF